MSGGTAAHKRWFRWRLSPRMASLCIVLLTFLGVWAVRHSGRLQFLDFYTYDAFLQRQPLAPTSEPLVLIEMTEADIHHPTLDYPIYDNKLAELLRKLEADQPAVIGLDIWRDIPVPKSGVFLSELNEAFLANSNLVAIFTLGGIAPPPALKSHPERIAFNDNFPVDVEVDRTVPKVRRSLLFASPTTDQNYDSLPFRLALLYLERLGITPEPDPEHPDSFRLGKATLHAFQANDGAYVRADARGWQILLDFKCPDRFTRYSVMDALSGKIPAGSLRDKIVLVGINTPSVSDERVTPMRRDHRGIEVQALTVHQLLRHALEGAPSLRFWGDWLEDAWILLWCAAGGAIGYAVRSPWRFASSLILAMLALTSLAWSAFQQGWWIPLVGPAVACVPAAALVTSYISYQEKKERKQLMQLFSKQVSPDIAEAIWEQRDEFLAGQRPRSQKLVASVLFTDLEGFSSTSEKMEPALLMDWLNEYMEAMANAVMAHQGVIEKYIGDSIMAVFGVPLLRATEADISQDARHAVRCALAMRQEMIVLNARWQERGLPLCGMRIGIHTGPLVAGSLGSADRQEYTVIGDSVNTASRLESFDKSWGDPESTRSRCRILISEATARLLRDEFQIKGIGTMTLKNKNEPVTIYSVTGVNQPTAGKP